MELVIGVSKDLILNFIRIKLDETVYALNIEDHSIFVA